MIKRILLAFLLIAAAAGGALWFWTTTPQYAVQQAQQAVKKHDLDAFHNWVDVQSVSRSAVEDVLAEPVRNVGSGILERVVGFGILAIFRPTVIEAVQKQIDTSVATSGLDTAEAPPPEPKGIVGQLVELIKPPSLTETLRDYGYTKQNYRGFGEVHTQDNTADVALRFFIPRVKAEKQVHLALMNISGHWRIVRIANLQQIVKDIAVGG